MGKIGSRPSASSKDASSSSSTRGAARGVASSAPARRGRTSALSSAEASATDWSRFDAITDADIEAAIAADPDAAPILDAAWFADAKLVLPEPKRQVTLRLDADLLDWFRAQGPGWQTRMNAVLRAWMQAQKPAK
jgi:uncharacterized protein (DUF4415 family)